MTQSSVLSALCFQVNLYNEIKANLTAQGINYDEPYYGTPENYASSDDRSVQSPRPTSIRGQ